MNILVRADASLIRGSGHVMRCLCLANILRQLGHTLTFACAGLPEHLRTLVIGSGHFVQDLADSGPFGLASEAAWPDAKQVADAAAIVGEYDLVIVDHYGLNRAWESAIKTRCSALAVIDDLGRQHVCDVLLDQNYYSNPAERYAGKLPPDCLTLIGPHYALLRPEFAEARRSRDYSSVNRLLVFLGGMDANDVTSHILDALDRVAAMPANVDVVIGTMHPSRSGIEARCAARAGWSCHVQTSRMADMLAASDMVIGAGGTNSWERMAVGTPSLALCVADNQRALLDECASAGVLYVPDDTALQDVSVLRTHIDAVLHNRLLRQQIGRSGLDLVDGKGAERVARAIGALQTISVRQATSADSDMLLVWRNHEAVRAVSRNPDVVSAEAHQAWFAAVMADDARSLLVGERDSVPIGCIRFDEIGPDAAEVSIYLSSDVFGMGLGRSLLSAGEAWMAKNRPHIARIHAEVLGGNTASTSLFERAGYAPDSYRFSKGLQL